MDGVKNLSQKIIPPRTTFKIKTLKNIFINNIKYNSYSNPFNPIYVNPTCGQRVSVLIEKQNGLGQVVNGDWDRKENTRKLSSYHNYTGLKQRFVENKEWEETVYYERNKKKIESPDSSLGYSDSEEFLNIRCKFVDELYQRIRDEGYRANFEAEHKAPAKGRDQKWRHWHELEPLICIGRDGELFWVEGLHRLAIARILEIDTIPVQVIARHKQWQELREDIYKNGFSKRYNNELKNHPDLRELSNT